MEPNSVGMANCLSVVNKRIARTHLFAQSPNLVVYCLHRVVYLFIRETVHPVVFLHTLTGNQGGG